MFDGRYGVERDAVHQNSIDLLPIVPFDRLDQAMRGRVELLSNRLIEDMSENLVDEIDAFIFDTFDLAKVERHAIRDTVETDLPSTVSKRRSLASPTSEESSLFTRTLAESLDSILSASRLFTLVRERAIPGLESSPWRIIEVSVSCDGVWSDVAPSIASFLKEADENGASLVIVRSDETTWLIGMMSQYRYWTPTRARLLANEIIAKRSLQ
jgi:hypothetical protein